MTFFFLFAEQTKSKDQFLKELKFWFVFFSFFPVYITVPYWICNSNPSYFIAKLVHIIEE